MIDRGHIWAGQEEIQIQFPLLSCTLSNVHLRSMGTIPTHLPNDVITNGCPVFNKWNANFSLIHVFSYH